MDGNGRGENVEVIEFNFARFVHKLELHFPLPELLLFQTHFNNTAVGESKIFFVETTPLDIYKHLSDS